MFLLFTPTPLGGTFLCLHVLADDLVSNPAEISKIIITNSCGVLITVTELDTHALVSAGQTLSAFAIGAVSGGFCSGKAGVCRLAHLVRVRNVVLPPSVSSQCYSWQHPKLAINFLYLFLIWGSIWLNIPNRMKHKYLSLTLHIVPAENLCCYLVIQEK